MLASGYLQVCHSQQAGAVLPPRAAAGVYEETLYPSTALASGVAKKPQCSR